MKTHQQKSSANTGPSRRRQHRRRHLRRQQGLVRLRRPAERVRSGERQASRGRSTCRPMPARPSTASICSRSPRSRIQKIDPKTGACSPRSPRPAAAAIPASPGPRARSGSGQYRERKIHQIDPETGKILRTIESNRFVTGVTWVDGEMWHGTWEGDESELRRIDPQTGEVLERLEMPAGSRRLRARVRRQRPLLLRRRQQRQEVRAVRRPKRLARLRHHIVPLRVPCIPRTNDWRGSRHPL